MSNKIANNETDDLENFLNSILKGLKHYSAKELSGAILQLLANKHDKWDETNFILDCVCEHYKISRKTLKHSTARGEIQQAKKLCYCLLNRELKLSMRYISYQIFSIEQHSSVNNAIRYFRNLDPKIKAEREFREKYEMLQRKLIEYINANKK